VTPRLCQTQLSWREKTKIRHLPGTLYQLVRRSQALADGIDDAILNQLSPGWSANRTLLPEARTRHRPDRTATATAALHASSGIADTLHTRWQHNVAFSGSIPLHRVAA
jgi:hypothetical protein